MGNDEVNKECHLEDHQKNLYSLPQGTNYWPKVLDSESEIHLIRGHNTQKPICSQIFILSLLFLATVAFVPLIQTQAGYNNSISSYSLLNSFSFYYLI